MPMIKIPKNLSIQPLLALSIKNGSKTIGIEYSKEKRANDDKFKIKGNINLV
jgi:hypothetical protein